MFICNVNLNKHNLIKMLFIIISIIVIIFFGISAFKIFKQTVKVNDTIPEPDVCVVETNNYTNILKTVHDNIDDYVGQKIKCTGYIYRVSDFTSTQFVIARDMVISSDMQTLVVGFLCNCKDAANLPDKTWIEITGTITRGDYHGEIPIIEINELKQVEKPENAYVYPPDENYVPTAVLY